jgi:hypothetical protein
MQKHLRNKKPNALSQTSFKKKLSKSGYSENAADKIWKWYSARIEKQRQISMEVS